MAESSSSNAVNQPMNQQQGDEINLVMLLHDCVRGAKKYFWLLIILCIVTVVGFVAFTYYTYVPMYSSKASFTVSATDGGYNTNFNYNQ